MYSKKLFMSLIGVFLVGIFQCGFAATYSLDLPPDEQVMLAANQQVQEVLTCEVEHGGYDNEHVINFVSANNTSVINNLILPEGTIMSLCFVAKNKDSLRLNLQPEAKLGITNNSNDFMRLLCNIG